MKEIKDSKNLLKDLKNIKQEFLLIDHQAGTAHRFNTKAQLEKWINDEEYFDFDGIEIFYAAGGVVKCNPTLTVTLYDSSGKEMSDDVGGTKETN